MLRDKKIGFALCGSFCTFGAAIPEIVKLAAAGAQITPIMSFNAYHTDTRFGRAEDFVRTIEEICAQKILNTLTDVEPIGPKGALDLLIIAPCTGNTLAKLNHSIADTPVTLAVKSHLRNARPVLNAVSTNDALAGAAENIGGLLARRHIFFVPFGQDDPQRKPRSLISEMTLIPEAAEAALQGEQIQPILL